MADQAGKNNIELEGLDIAGDLDELKKNIAKFKKGKFGKGLADFEINNLDWIDQNSRKVKAVTIFIYETSVWNVKFRVHKLLEAPCTKFALVFVGSH